MKLFVFISTLTLVYSAKIPQVIYSEQYSNVRYQPEDFSASYKEESFSAGDEKNVMVNNGGKNNDVETITEEDNDKEMVTEKEPRSMSEQHKIIPERLEELESPQIEEDEKELLENQNPSNLNPTNQVTNQVTYQGTYYLYQNNGNLQKVEYYFNNNQPARLLKLKLTDVQPISGPLYIYNPTTYSLQPYTFE